MWSILAAPSRARRAPAFALMLVLPFATSACWGSDEDACDPATDANQCQPEDVRGAHDAPDTLPDMDAAMDADTASDPDVAPPDVQDADLEDPDADPVPDTHDTSDTAPDDIADVADPDDVGDVPSDVLDVEPGDADADPGDADADPGDADADSGDADADPSDADADPGDADADPSDADADPGDADADPGDADPGDADVEPGDSDADLGLPPVARFTLSPTLGCAPLLVSVDGSTSEADQGALVDWAWTFGDGALGSGEVTTHTYTSAGTFDVTLRVRDDAGRTGDADPRSVRVFDPDAGVHTWVGLHPTSPTAWSQPTNWCPASVPGSGDDVILPGGLPFYPDLTSNVTVRSLTLKSGAALTNRAGLTVLGDLDVNAGALVTVAAGFATVGGDIRAPGAVTGTLRHTAAPGLVRGNVGRYEPQPGADIALSGALVVGEASTLTGSLTLNGHTMTTRALFSVSGSSGALVMRNAADELIVEGTLQLISAGGSADRHSAGIIRVRGPQLTIGTTSNALVGSGTHLVVFEGSEPQVLRSQQSNNRFQDVEFANPAGVVLSGGMQVVGDVIMSDGTLTSESTNITDQLFVAGTVRGQGEGFGVNRVYFSGSPDLPSRLGARITVLEGVVELGRNVHLHGDLLLLSPGGQLHVGVHELSVDGRFETGGRGMLYMRHSASRVRVHGDAFFGGLGPAEDGPLGPDNALTAGVLSIDGDVRSAIGSGRFLFATGEHTLVLSGDELQRLRLAGGCRLAHLEGVGRGGLEIQDSLSVIGDFFMYVNLVVSGSFTVEGNMTSGSPESGPGSGFGVVQRNDGRVVIGGTHFILADSSFTQNGTEYVAGAIDVRGRLVVNETRRGRALGNFTAEAGAEIHNEGTLEYGGDLHDRGATFSGNPLTPLEI